MSEKINHEFPPVNLEKLLPIVNSIAHQNKDDLSEALTHLKQMNTTQFIGGEVQKNAFIQTIEGELKRKTKSI